MESVTIGNATLYCGDCLEILPTLGNVDSVITDPPYGEKTHKGARKSVDELQITFAHISDDYAVELFKSLVEKSKRWVIATVEWRHLKPIEDALPIEFIRAGVWVKPSYTPQFTGDRPATGWEAIAILHRKGIKRWNGGGKCAVYQFNTEGGYHETQKPVALASRFLVDFTDKHETILDPFMGSGTTGVACMNLDRKFIGIEIDRKYFDIACQRIEQAQQQLKLAL